jgi:hypothetical protein
MFQTLDWKGQVEPDLSQRDLWPTIPSDQDRRSVINLVPVAEGIARVTPDGRAVLISASPSQRTPARDA